MGVLRDMVNTISKKYRKRSGNNGQVPPQIKFERSEWEFKFDISPVFTFLLFLLVIGIINILVYFFYKIWVN